MLRGLAFESSQVNVGGETTSKARACFGRTLRTSYKRTSAHSSPTPDYRRSATLCSQDSPFPHSSFRLTPPRYLGKIWCF